jgi:hypothetical protein
VPAALFGATLLVATILLFIRVPSTTIELDIAASGLGFISAEQQPLNRPLLVSALGVSGFTAVQLPDEAMLNSAEARSVRIAAESLPRAGSGSIVVDRIIVPAGTRVWLSVTDVPNQYRLALRSSRPAPIAVHVDVTGPIAFVGVGSTTRAKALPAPRPVDFTGTTGALDIDLLLRRSSPGVRWQQLAATDLQLYRLEDEQDGDRPLVRPISTVLSGSIYFESLAGNEHRLRPGEMLRFDRAIGTIQTLGLGENAIATTFQGDVHGMRAGAGEYPRSLMPTLLDWLQERQGLSLLWGSALYLFGISLTLRRWWRRARETA